MKEYSHQDVVKILVGSKSDLVPGDVSRVLAEEYVVGCKGRGILSEKQNGSLHVDFV